MIKGFLRGETRKLVPRRLKTAKHLLKGVGTYLPPPLQSILPRHSHQFYGISVRTKNDPVELARTAYGTWLRYLVVFHELGLSTSFENMGEIGPGDSLGVGLAGLLSGAKNFSAMDVVSYAYTAENEAILNELISLFEKRSPIPDNNEFPKAKPVLHSYEFPAHILTEERLSITLAPERIDAIRRALRQVGQPPPSTDREGITISYAVPWDKDSSVKKHSLDVIISQAALEHVENLERTYFACSTWLRPGGVMAHIIDFKSHETASSWDGHWAYGDTAWRIIKGKCAYLINREPHSWHLAILKACGFTVLRDDVYSMRCTLERSDLAKRFVGLTDTDLTTASAFMVSLKG